jgi:hypothetical protein
MDPNTEICVTCGGTEAMMAAVPGSSFFKEPVNHLIRMHFAFLMHKQQPQTAYRKDAVLTGTIFENCDKKEDITRFFA